MFGKLKIHFLKLFTDLTRREFNILLPLVILTIFLGLKPGVILNTITNSINNYIFFY